MESVKQYTSIHEMRKSLTNIYLDSFDKKFKELDPSTQYVRFFDEAYQSTKIKMKRNTSATKALPLVFRPLPMVSGK